MQPQDRDISRMPDRSRDALGDLLQPVSDSYSVDWTFFWCQFTSGAVPGRRKAAPKLPQPVLQPGGSLHLSRNLVSQIASGIAPRSLW